MHLYPNPASEFVHLEITGVRNRRVKVEIFTIHGQKLSPGYEEFSINEKHRTRVDVSHLAAGPYLILVHIDGVAHRRVIIRV